MTNTTTVNKARVLIRNARLAFPNLWEAKSGDDGGNPTYGGLFIIPPDHPQMAEIKAAMAHVAKEKWAAKAEAIFKQLKAQDKLALHDGETKSQYDGFSGMLYISARAQARPSIFDRGRVPLQAKDGKPYAGCYVNVSVEFWAQDNGFGKRVNAQLRGVQFVADGDAFASGRPASEDEFDDLGDQGGETASAGAGEPDEDPFG